MLLLGEAFSLLRLYLIQARDSAISDNIMCSLIILITRYSSAGEAAFVGILTGLLMTVVISIYTWISRKKAKKRDLKNYADDRINAFAKADYATYYRLQVPELMALCSPQRFMKPYDHEKVSVSNELYVRLQSKNLSTDDILDIRKIAETVLGVRLSDTQLFEYLKEVCNPRLFMEPYDSAKISRANDLYGDIMKNAQNLCELERIGKIAQQEGFMSPKTKSPSTSQKDIDKAEKTAKMEIIRRYGAYTGEKIYKHEIEVGWSKHECVASWGEPDAKDIIGQNEFTYERWTYLSRSTYLFFNSNYSIGKLHHIEKMNNDNP